MVDVDYKSAMSAPEVRRIKQLQQFLQSAAFRVSLEALSHHSNDALIDGGIADLSLIDQQQPALRLDNKLSGLRRARCAIGPAQQSQQRVELGLDGRISFWAPACGARTVNRHAAASPLHGLLHTRAIERFEQGI